MPLPTFCRADAPALFWIVPPNVVETVLLPTVKVGVPPARVSIVPLPERLPTVALYVFRSNVPPPRVTLPVLGKSGQPQSCTVEPAGTLAIAAAALPPLWLRPTFPAPMFRDDVRVACRTGQYQDTGAQHKQDTTGAGESTVEGRTGDGRKDGAAGEVDVRVFRADALEHAPGEIEVNA